MTTSAETPNRNIPMGYLRTFLTLLVVAHHAALAYHPYVPPSKGLDSTMIWAAFPVVDAKKLPGIDLFTGINDTFFMALMFFVSGVFAWGSLQRKGSLAFLRDRAVRLGIPFVIAAGLLAPLAYYPAWLTAHTPSGSFWKQWLALSAWPAGPAWFLWVLLAFGCVAAAIFAIAPRFGNLLGRITERLSSKPVVYFAAFVALSALAYLPMAAKFDPLRWVSFGPFFVKSADSSTTPSTSSLASEPEPTDSTAACSPATERLARRWELWLTTALLAFVVLIGSVIAIIGALKKGSPPTSLLTFANFAFVVTCASFSLTTIALFARYARNGNPIGNSLSANAYGIYILHYACVSWLQFALLDAPLPAIAKFGVVTVGTISASWLASAGLRRIPAIARVI